MRRRDALWSIALSITLLRCGGGETTPPDKQPEPACPAPEVSLPDGSCNRPGVPLDGCGDGFQHDSDYGCTPVLPTESCPPGLMAVPGEADCRPVSPCAQGRWGDIPVDATTLYVDGASLGGDGSAQNPFKTIGAAVTAASTGALVAVAAGSYTENVVVGDKRLRLWGVCPQRVQIVGSAVGSGCPAAALCIKGSLAGGTEVHALALTGAAVGLTLSGATAVVADRVWVHDNASWGIDAENALGPTALSVTDSLLEHNHEFGALAMGVDFDFERSIVRGTLSRTTDGVGGVGIGAELQCSQAADGSVTCNKASPARVTLRSAIIEGNHDIGLVVQGSELTMDGSVVRGTLPRDSDQRGGEGISIQVPCLPDPKTVAACDPSAPSHAVIRTSMVSANAVDGMSISGSVADIETTVVRDQSVLSGIIVSEPCFDPGDGSFACTSNAPSQVTVSSCLIDHNAYVALLISGSTATITGTVVRGTDPRPTDMQFGRGVSAEEGCSQLADGTLTCDPNAPAMVTLARSLITANRGEGLHVVDSAATVDTTVIADTTARTSGEFGDGISVFSDLAAAQVSIRTTRIQRSARAGLSSFGASATLEQVSIECSGFDLQGETFGTRPASVEDHGEVLCGCPAATKPCQISDAQLTPPEPIAPKH